MFEEFSHFFQESNTPDRTNNVYTKSGNITKIDNVNFDKVYFGSPTNYGDHMDLDGPLFVSPYPGIASIFSVRPQKGALENKYKLPVDKITNRGYVEWDRSLIPTKLKKPLKELHVLLEGDLDFEPITDTVTGYLHEIELTPELKDHIYQSDKMSREFEYCIDRIDSVKFSKTIPVTIKMTIQPKNKNVVQESKLPAEERNKLDDSDFGIPETRSYPLHDKSHVEAAVHMFPKAPLKHRRDLAKRILRKAHEFNMDTSNWGSMKPYMEYAEAELIFEQFITESHKTHFKRTMERLDYDPETQTIKTDLKINGKPLRLKMVMDNRDGDDTCFIHFDKKMGSKGYEIPDYSTGEIHISRKLLKTKTWNAMFSVKHEEGHAYVYAQLFSDGKPTKAKLKVDAEMSNAIDMLVGNGDKLSEHGLLPDEYVADKYGADHTSKMSAIKALERIKSESYITERNKRVAEVKRKLDTMIEKRNKLSDDDIEKCKDMICKLSLLIADVMKYRKDYMALETDIPEAKKLVEKIDDLGNFVVANHLAQIQRNYIDKLNYDQQIAELKKARTAAEKSQDCYLFEMDLRKKYVNKYAKG